MGSDGDGVQREIGRAKALYLEHGGALALVDGSHDLLERYRKAVVRTGDMMEGLEVTAACSRCAGTKAGSCCFEGVEEWYDHVSLYVNFALGAVPPVAREIPGGCLFLGKEGCRLAARHAFCINYLCPDLRGALGPSERARLLYAAGEEILLGWELEKAIRRRISRT